jgi:hypothetical protein
MASRSGANRSRMVSSNNHCAHIADLVALATLAARALPLTGVRETR